ncbi:hypothetical protein ZIOFF_014917 [Zingiber officinale]|uniref:Uncharacterized protein n=1 Tax=Zingiber officinale TaxID=94328 RepID=A0A8J5LM10_ZINOF|nr:hypothetical protein ZIOFF_014917 [Zingiber officinale]
MTLRTISIFSLTTTEINLFRRQFIMVALQTLLKDLELFLSSGTVCLSLYALVAGVFGMNIPYSWNDGHGYVYKWVI